MHRFAGRPQPVEIHHAGIWYSGELLGWQHEDDGRVTARVRVRLDGLRHSFWKDLAELRLPDPHHPPRTEALAAALGRPAPTDPGEADDRTRPHVLRAAPGIRPSRPAHVTTPPAPRPAAVSAALTTPPARRAEAPLSLV